MHFEHSVLNPGIVTLVFIGGLVKNNFDLRMPATPVVLTLEKAYLEPGPINAIKTRDIRRLVS
jgi:hypothetical protein